MKKINVAELLKDCPKGMELDCTMLDKVILDGVDNSNDPVFPIRVRSKDGYLILLTKYGQYFDDDYAKCVIFPKGKTTWEGFQRSFKDGDIVATDLGSVFILKSCLEDKIRYHSYIGVTCCNEIQEKQRPFAYKYACHLATEEEKQKLFQAIKDNGYKWNSETKTLEKLIVPKFKVGDRIRHKNDKTIIKTICYVYHNSYALYDGHLLLFTDQDMWELAPNKFDINTLKPFESRVLVRDYDNMVWIPTFWGKHLKDDSICSYLTTNGCYKQCIPYEGNQHLLGKTDDCDEYFKTWK